MYIKIYQNENKHKKESLFFIYDGMTGGTLQLKAYGSENIYLNANPQISFFRSVFKRHTNFAMETIELPFEGTTLTSDAGSAAFSSSDTVLVVTK